MPPKRGREQSSTPEGWGRIDYLCDYFLWNEGVAVRPHPAVMPRSGQDVSLPDAAHLAFWNINPLRIRPVGQNPERDEDVSVPIALAPLKEVRTTGSEWGRTTPVNHFDNFNHRIASPLAGAASLFFLSPLYYVCSTMASVRWLKSFLGKGCSDRPSFANILQ